MASDIVKMAVHKAALALEEACIMNATIVLPRDAYLSLLASLGDEAEAAIRSHVTHVKVSTWNGNIIVRSEP